MRSNYPETSRYLAARRAQHPRDDAIEDYTEWTLMGQPVNNAPVRPNLPGTTPSAAEAAMTKAPKKRRTSNTSKGEATRTCTKCCPLAEVWAASSSLLVVAAMEGVLTWSSKAFALISRSVCSGAIWGERVGCLHVRHNLQCFNHCSICSLPEVNFSSVCSGACACGGSGGAGGRGVNRCVGRLVSQSVSE